MDVQWPGTRKRLLKRPLRWSPLAPYFLFSRTDRNYMAFVYVAHFLQACLPFDLVLMPTVPGPASWPVFSRPAYPLPTRSPHCPPPLTLCRRSRRLFGWPLLSQSTENQILKGPQGRWFFFLCFFTSFFNVPGFFIHLWVLWAHINM